MEKTCNKKEGVLDFLGLIHPLFIYFLYSDF